MKNRFFIVAGLTMLCMCGCKSEEKIDIKLKIQGTSYLDKNIV